MAVHSWKDSPIQSGNGQVTNIKQNINIDRIDKACIERQELKSDHRELFLKIAEILFRHDPMFINYEINDNEYEPEAGTIIPRGMYLARWSVQGFAAQSPRL